MPLLQTDGDSMEPTDDPEWREVGGELGEVWTDGESVKRPVRASSEAVCQLFDHLECRGVEGVPRCVGVEGGYEVVTYLPGEAAMRPWPEALQSPEWLVAVGAWLRQVHEATRDFEFRDEARFTWGPAEPSATQVVNHGDLCPWNMLVDEGAFAGVIDWEFARFGPPVDGLAEAAFELGPLRENREMLRGGVTEERIRRRVDALCRGYGGVDSGDVIARVEPMLEERLAEARRLAEAGRALFVASVEAGAEEALEADLAYFRERWTPT